MEKKVQDYGAEIERMEAMAAMEAQLSKPTSAPITEKPLPLCAALAGLFCVLGHIFPVFLHFRGGKGTACLCGTVLGLTPELVLPLLALMFIIGMIWNRASILPLLTALVYAPLYLLRTGDWRSTIALALIFPAMLWAHRSNFARWREGKEQTFRQFLFGRHEPQREEAGE